MPKFLATVKLLVAGRNQADACDAIAEMLRPGTIDWCYLSETTPPSVPAVDPLFPDSPPQFTAPIEIKVDYYREGDLRLLTGEEGKEPVAVKPRKKRHAKKV